MELINKSIKQTAQNNKDANQMALIGDVKSALEMYV